MTTAVRNPRASLLRIAIGAWLVLISAVVILDHAKLSGLVQHAESAADTTAVAALQSRLLALEQEVASLQGQPATVSQASFTAAHQQIDARLTDVDQRMTDMARSDELAALQARVAQTEARLAKARSTAPVAATARRPAATVVNKPAVITPPFTVLGIESRGGERFISVAPVGAVSLDQVQVLRRGDAQGAWQLEAIDGETVAFRHDGLTHRIAVPRSPR